MPTCCDTFILRPGALDPFSCQPAAQARCALSTGRVVLEVDGIAFGKLETGGAMILAGMLQVLPMGAGILPHNFYAILDAVGTRTGTFDQLETTGIAVAYDGTRVVLCNPPPPPEIPPVQPSVSPPAVPPEVPLPPPPVSPPAPPEVPLPPPPVPPVIPPAPPVAPPPPLVPPAPPEIPATPPPVEIPSSPPPMEISPPTAPMNAPGGPSYRVLVGGNNSDVRRFDVNATGTLVEGTTFAPFPGRAGSVRAILTAMARSTKRTSPVRVAAVGFASLGQTVPICCR